VIRKHTRRAAKAAFAISLGVAIVIGLFAAAAARPASSAPAAQTATAVVIGTKNFPEEFILGQLYKQALEAKGFTVQYKENIGSTEIIDTALTSGKINFYPEYTGVIVQVVFGKPLSAKTALGTYQLAKNLQEGRGFTLFDPTPFYDTDAIAVLRTTQVKYKLKTLFDLKKVPNLKLAALPEFKTRNTGLVGLRRNYKLTKVKFVPLAGISPYQALDKKTVQAAAVFSTDPVLGPTSKYRLLSDPKHQFGFQNVAPVVKKSLATELGPKFRDTIDAVSAKLTNNAIIAMNKAVIINKKSAADVASAFLKANGLT
jgi:osmoprotectant transport system substrate-binding protein